ncbi:flippase [Bifidobacterium simiiventris]|uniref:flippase n=1 Tax=Bifidobacterium simiiventris TaxID=2834434 RepID=UPI001C58FB06|nr:flippase [Bifidobacterium simiiventris]MBW3078680.1 flippase [Bifidobacterium simiiventris]
MTNIKKNYVYNLMYELLAIIVPLVTTPYVSRVLGATAIGDFNYVTSIVSYFGLFAVTGTVSYGNREIAIRQKNEYDRSKLFWEIFIFRFLFCVFATILYVFFFLNFLLQYKFLFLVQLFTAASWFIDVSWFCQGMGNFKVTAIRNSLVKILCTVGIFVFVKSSHDLWIYNLLNCASIFLGNVTMWGYVLKNVIYIPLRKMNVFIHSKQIFSLFIPVLAVQLYTMLNKTILGALSNTTEVGYYSQAERVIKIALTIPSSLISVMFPVMALLYSEKKIQQLHEYISKVMDFIFMLSLPMMVGCIVVAYEFVPFFFGPGYDSVVPVMQVLSFLFIILNIGRLSGTILVSIGKQNLYTRAVVVASIVNIILNIIFISLFQMGSLGVSISTVIAEVLATVIQAKYVGDIISPKAILESFIKYCYPMGFMLVVLLILNVILPIGIISLIVKILVASLSYFLILALRKDRMLSSLLAQIKRKFIRL